jgi:demethylmenaquinone methyltransferase/2-methoxy-6-polyprenyl-1,4-benzoquinol methylase
MNHNAAAQELFRGLPDRYDGLAEVLSFGQNARWRRTMVDAAVRLAPRTVCDVATGTAGVACQLVERSEARVVGVDLSEPMLERGRHTIERHKFGDRIDLVAARAEQLPFADAAFDALTFTYLLRYVEDPAATLRELVRVVRPGGVVASLDFQVPPAALLRWAWRVYTRVVLPVAGLLLGGRPWARVGRFLGPNIEQHYHRYPVSWLREAWAEAGIVDVNVRSMSLGGGLVMWGRRSA